MRNDRLICVLGVIVLWLVQNAGNLSLLSDSPCPGEGLHVLIIEDRPARRQLPAGQLSGLMSIDIDKAITDRGGRKCMYDQRQDVSAKDDWVKRAWSLPRQSLPWIVLDQDGRGVSQPAPRNLQEFKSLLESY